MSVEHVRGRGRCDDAHGKVKYSRAEAEAKAKQARRRARDAGDPAPITEYACSSCGWWHYGHAPGEVQARRRMQRTRRRTQRR